MEMEKLHAMTMNRRYDLRVCNPLHGKFYALMNRYQDVVDNIDGLLALAEAIDAEQRSPGRAPDMAESYSQIGELARWRVDQLRGERQA